MCMHLFLTGYGDVSCKKKKNLRGLLEILNKHATDDNVKVLQSIAYDIHEV